jgi:hypothetical protein
MPILVYLQELNGCRTYLRDGIMYLMRKATVRKKRTPSIRRPDFLARLLKIYGRKRLKMRGAELVTHERNRY